MHVILISQGTRVPFLHSCFLRGAGKQTHTEVTMHRGLLLSTVAGLFMVAIAGLGLVQLGQMNHVVYHPHCEGIACAL